MNAADFAKKANDNPPKEWRETELRSPRYSGLETWPTGEVLSALLSGQYQSLQAVSAALPNLEKAVSAAAARLNAGKGRLVYLGAGTSGRLAVLDGIELGPTFGWPDDRIAYLFAGGDAGLKHAEEGAEDSGDLGRSEISRAGVGPNDVVLGLAASGTTPYTREGIKLARERGALTIAFANNPQSPLLEDAEIGILLRTGPEVLAGSTRLAAGTSQKVALNLFSTALMVRLNKVYQGRMVDMEASNEKLVARAEGMVMDLTGCGPDAARQALNACSYHTKTAILIVDGHSPAEAAALLDRFDGDLGAARAGRSANS